MKKFLLILISSVIIILIMYIVLILQPKNIHFNAQGIKYRLGEENVGTEKLIKIDISECKSKILTGLNIHYYKVI